MNWRCARHMYFCPSVRLYVSPSVSFLSALVLRNYWKEFNEIRCEVSLWCGDVQDVCNFGLNEFPSELWPFDYFYIYTSGRFLSALVLCNYWMEFNETWCEVSLWIGDVQDYVFFGSMNFLHIWGLHYFFFFPTLWPPCLLNECPNHVSSIHLGSIHQFHWYSC
jgi:hypothetical protein